MEFSLNIEIIHRWLSVQARQGNPLRSTASQSYKTMMVAAKTATATATTNSTPLN